MSTALSLLPNFKTSYYTIVLSLNRNLPTELILKIMFYNKGIAHPIASMLQNLKKVSLDTYYTKQIYESFVVNYQFGNKLYDLQDIRGRQGHRDIFKFIRNIYQPLIDNENISFDNIEKRYFSPLRDGWPESWVRLNTNPNVILTPQYKVVKWVHEEGEFVTMTNTPRWEFLDDEHQWGNGAHELVYSFE